MSISPDLFDSVLPPEMWVTLGPVEPAYNDERPVVVRIKPFGRRSMTVRVAVSRYAPERSIFLALSHFVADCHAAQKSLTRDEVRDILVSNVVSYVEPF